MLLVQLVAEELQRRRLQRLLPVDLPAMPGMQDR